MALGFLKKVFSFGRKDEPAPPPEDEPLAPLDLDALKTLAPSTPPEREQPTAGVADEMRDPAPPLESVAEGLAEPELGPAPSSPLERDVPAQRAEGVADEALEVASTVDPVSESPTEDAAQDLIQPSQASAAPVAEPALPVEAERDSPSTPIPAVTTEQALVPPSFSIDAEQPAPQADAVTGEALDVAAPSHERGIEQTPSPAAITPSGPSDHLPLKGGESLAPSAASVSGKVTVGKAVAKKVERAPEPVAPEPRKTWFQRLRDGLSRSSRELTGSISGIFTRRKLDEETLEELEEVLIRADLGVETALRITDTLASSRYGKDVSDSEVRAIMAQEVEKVLTPVALPLELDLSHKPHVILVVGVNGTGKTTTIGKLAAKLTAGGLSVMLAAGDTFRAAAIEQLKIWGERTGSPVVSSKLGADAAGLAWDAFERARAAGSDVLIIDTAGRLQNKAELMAELEKVVRVLGRHDPDAPHTVLQTVDATTGQNALNQVEIFRNVAGVNGLVMTKLDGTARGGILVAIAAKHRLPVYFIGVGEQVDDLEPFSASEFARAIAGVG